MATAAKRQTSDMLSVAFNYDTEPAEGSIVEITSARKVQALTASGRSKIVGEVGPVRSDLLECTIYTKFRSNRQDRVAGEAVAIGPFVFGAGNLVYQYSPGAKALVTGSTTGVKTYVVDTSDVVKIKYGGETSQTFTITAGTDVPMATVAAEINATAVGFTAGVDGTGHFTLTGDEIGKPIEVEAVTHDAYTLLGLTAGITRCAGPSHDASEIAGLVVVAGAEGATVETLEY